MARQDGDRNAPFADAMRRYGCTDTACGWQGLLPRQASARRSRGRLPAVLAKRLQSVAKWTWTVPLVGSALAIGLIVALGSAPQDEGARVTRPAMAPGEHSDGDLLAPLHPLAKADPVAAAIQPEVDRLPVRQGCTWGKPGRDPYKGTVSQALLTARLPQEVVERIAHKVAGRQVDDRVEITNAGIRADRDRREFEPKNVAMTYGRTLCVNTRVNFPAGHVERASLYEAADRKGRLYSVMVPDVCGNVSVLGVRMERRRPRVLAVADDSPTLPVLSQVGDTERATRVAIGDPGQVVLRTVPEPSTWACLAAAFMGWGFIAWRQRRAVVARAVSRDASTGG